MGFDDDKITKGPVTIPSKPLISVVVANFNHAKYIEDNFKGLLGQTYENWELIVVDDASTDHSKDVISRYAALDQRIKPIYLDDNLGAVGAFNVGLGKVSGQYMLAIGADDYIYNNRFFELAVQAINLFPDVAGVFMQIEIIDAENDSLLYIEGGGVQAGYVSPDQAIVCFFEGKLHIPSGAALWRFDLFNDVGYIDDLGQQSDYLLNHVLSCTHGVYYIEGIGAKMRKSSSSYSGSQENDDFFVKMAKVEKAVLDHVGEGRVSNDLRRVWRLNIMNTKFRFYLQVRFIDMVRGFDIQPWEYDGLPERIITARQWMLEQAEAVEQEMNATYAAVSSTFDKIAGKL